MAIQLLAMSAEFRPLASSVIDDADLAIQIAESAFLNVPECAYVEFTIMSDDNGFEFRIEILTHAELTEGI